MTRNDIEADAGMARRDKALARGYRSEVVLPLIVNDREYGVMCIFAEEAGFFDEQELKLLLELTSDVSFALEYIEKEEKLNYLAYYDVITGLPNRTLFNDRLTQRVSASRSEGASFFVLMLDIERFRQINETLGRHAGDDLLKQLAQRLRAILLPTDIVAHFDGDYFAVATRRTEEDGDVAHLLDHVLRGTSGEPFRIDGAELRFATRAGIAAYPEDGADVDSLLSNAEAALKDAKRTGQRYLFYASQMNARVAEQMKLETELRRAVLEEQFVLYYQPRVDIASGKISGLEALIRWTHPERGLVPPNDFIPLLESTGLIVEVGRWALRQAALDFRKWHDAGLKPPRIAVNVSQVQLRHKDFVDDVGTALSAAGECRDQMDIEITESMLMENIDGNIEKLRAVQAMGVQIAMDDFGTGYSSLSYLAKLPINSLKIDRSFISEMGDGPEQMAIVSTVISLGRALNLKVVAEGVETEEQKRLLRLLKCDEIQGYLFSPPLPSVKIENMIRQLTGS
jgi:diguanylate cyclase (GGDEF)-like protein